MGNITFHNIGAFLHHKRRKEEAIILTNVIPTGLLYYINTLSSLACLSTQRRACLSVICYTGSLHLLAACACRTQENYKINRLFKL